MNTLNEFVEYIINLKDDCKVDEYFVVLNTQNFYNVISYLDANEVAYSNTNHEIKIQINSLRNKIGYYPSVNDFIEINKYELERSEYYIKDINDGSDGRNGFNDQISILHIFIQSLINISTHRWEDEDGLKLILYRSKKSILLDINYSYNLIKKLDHKRLEIIKDFSIQLNEANEDKRGLFINEIIDYVTSNNIDNLEGFVSKIELCYKSCKDSYELYQLNYCVNSLKLELDTKVLDYTTKIQQVISEAQTKLIAIPAAFIFAGINIDYDKGILNTNNIIISLCLFTFAILIQLFIQNQKSILFIIEKDSKDYIDTFKSKIDITDKLNIVNRELKNQKKRICFIEIILWTIPILLLLFLFLKRCEMVDVIVVFGISIIAFICRGTRYNSI